MAANITIPGYAKVLMAIAAVFMPFFLILPFFFWGNEDNLINLAEENIQRGRLAPVGRLTLAGETVAADAGAAAFDPQTTYNNVCAACHATGVLNAPKIGEQAQWQAKIDERGGIDAIIAQGIKGINAMPPKGGATVSDENFGLTVKYMLANSGFDVDYGAAGGTPADTGTESAPAESTPAESTPADAGTESAPAETGTENKPEAAPTGGQ